MSGPNLCSMCCHGTSTPRTCEHCGRVVCSHMYRSHHGDYCDKAAYDVVVGNIGFVRSGVAYAEALTAYAEYVEQSKSGYGRASGESVTILKNGEIVREHVGQNEGAE